MKAPKVSIIVPVYKTEKYLTRCLESLTKQTLSNIEILLIDDGSPDNCPTLCDEAAATDSRIMVIHKQNQGLGMARNTGIDNATGEYIGFVDSDDYVAENMFELLYSAAKNEQADLALSGICFVGGNMFGKENEFVKKPYFKKLTTFKNKEQIKNLMLGIAGALPDEADDSRYGMSVCKNIFLTETIKKHNLHFLSEREILSEDALFMMDFVAKSKSAIGIPQCLYYYCRNDNSLSKSYNSSRFEKSIIFVNELENRLKNHICESVYKLYLDRLIQGFGRVLCSQEIMHAKECNIPFKDLKKRLRAICTHPYISNTLKTYPIMKLPIKQAVFAFTIKHKLFFAQKILVYLREK